MTNLGKRYDDLPQIAKGIISVVVVASIVGIGILVYTKIKSFTRRIGEDVDPKKALSQIDSELHELSKTQRQNYPDSNYTSWANQLFVLFDGCDFGKNEVAAVNIFDKIKNDTDFLKLVKAFGVKTINNCGWGTGTYEADLPTVVNKEMLTITIRAMNNVFHGYGMKMRF